MLDDGLASKNTVGPAFTKIESLALGEKISYRKKLQNIVLSARDSLEGIKPKTYSARSRASTSRHLLLHKSISLYHKSIDSANVL